MKRFLMLTLLSAVTFAATLYNAQAGPLICPNKAPHCSTRTDCATYCMGITGDPSQAECRYTCCVCLW